MILPVPKRFKPEMEAIEAGQLLPVYAGNMHAIFSAMEQFSLMKPPLLYGTPAIWSTRTNWEAPIIVIQVSPETPKKRSHVVCFVVPQGLMDFYEAIRKAAKPADILIVNDAVIVFDKGGKMVFKENSTVPEWPLLIKAVKELL